MKKGYSKPLTEIEMNVMLETPLMGASNLNQNPDSNNFDPKGLDNASLVGGSPRMNMQSQANNLWDENE
jgi:hypothetical protein